MKLWLSLLLLMFPGLALAQIDPVPAGQFVRQYAAHYRVSPELVGALIDVESRWNPRALSSKGAMGLMQLALHCAESAPPASRRCLHCSLRLHRCQQRAGVE
jgi:hypothetical protein